MTDVEAAWGDVHDATPSGWHVGRPSLHDEMNQWEQYAYDPAERPRVGKRSREWIAIGRTEIECLREMARCLGEIKAGRWPR